MVPIVLVGRASVSASYVGFIRAEKETSNPSTFCTPVQTHQLGSSNAEIITDIYRLAFQFHRMLTRRDGEAVRTAPPLRWVGVQKDIPAPRTWLSKPSFPIIVGFSSSPFPCSLVFTKLPFPLQRSTQSHKLYLVLCTSLPELPVSLSSCHASPEPRRIQILLLGSLSDSSVLLLTYFFFWKFLQSLSTPSYWNVLFPYQPELLKPSWRACLPFVLPTGLCCREEAHFSSVL